MTSSSSSSSGLGAKAAPDWAALWERARRLHPIYAELVREFAIEAPDFQQLDFSAAAPDPSTVKQAEQCLQELDDRVEVHQLRQFLQTSTAISDEGLIALIQHFIGKSVRTAGQRDKLDFLLVQYFSHGAPGQLDDAKADIGYVAKALLPVLGKMELKTPLWLNSLDRVLEAARRCRSLDELLHGGVLDQGRKAKAQAGDLFYMPIALVAFTRYGYLMRRSFFRLMHADLNEILDGLNQLEEQGVDTIDCRRAQFSQKEPIARLRMICQSWKVMFQAEYSSGQPLRMLVDLRASVDFALGKGVAPETETEAPQAGAVTKTKTDKPAPVERAAATAVGKTAPGWGNMAEKAKAVPEAEAPEFEISAAPDEEDSGAGKPRARKK